MLGKVVGTLVCVLVQILASQELILVIAVQADAQAGTEVDANRFQLCKLCVCYCVLEGEP